LHSHQLRISPEHSIFADKLHLTSTKLPLNPPGRHVFRSGM
jgi:hypothetical protein